MSFLLNHRVHLSMKEFCDRCTVQVIQWMAEHAYNNPGAYSYHHCAHVKITANDSMPIDEGWPVQQSATHQ